MTPQTTSHDLQTAPKPVLTLENITKSFGPVTVLDGVTIHVRPGWVQAILGENGAGKSTLIKMMAGIYQPDGGRIIIDDDETVLPDVHAAFDRGIATIHQELNLMPNMTVAENISMGRIPNRGGLVNKAEMRATAVNALARIGLDIDPDHLVGQLGVARQQLVEIAKALSLNARILILDEPTAALTQSEIRQLFDVINELRQAGVAMVFISHHLEEIAEIADAVSVLRDGTLIDEVSAKTPENILVKLMVGRDITEQYPRRRDYRAAKKTLLRVDNLTRKGVLQSISFEAHAGEVIGIAGLVGAGRTELLRCIAGADSYDSGSIAVSEKPLPKNSVAAAIRAGIGHVPEDRKNQGLVLGAAISENLGYATLRTTAHWGLVDRSGQRHRAQEISAQLRIRMRDLEQRVKDLSGGNQQKVVFGKWILAGSNILLLDEPTRGVDVGARVEIYEFINEITANGGTVIMVSSDLPEVLGMSDRILVLSGGHIAGELDAATATQDQVMALAIRDIDRDAEDQLHADTSVKGAA